MSGRWWRLIVLPILAAWLLPAPIALPVAAAGCALATPGAPLSVGTQVSIIGSGFPADADIAVSFANGSSAPTEITAHSDTVGAFTLSLVTESGDLGSTTVTAVAPGVCTAQAVLVVEAPNAAAPTASPAASASASASAAAAPSATAAVRSSPVPTSKPASSSGSAQPLASTTEAPVGPADGPALPSALLALGLLIAAIGAAGWLGARSVGRGRT